MHRKRSRVSSRSRTSARQRNTAVVTLIAISPSYTLYAFVNLVRLIINEERSNNSIVSNPCSVPMNNRNDVYGLNRCERFNSWVKIECSGGSRVVSRLFYYLSDAMRANARQKVSSTAHKIGSGRDAGVINLVRSLGKGGDSRATDCIGRKSPVAGWSRAKPCHRVLPCYRGRTKTESEIRPPLGRRAAANGSRAGGGGSGGKGGAGFGTRERKKTTSGRHIRGQLSNKQTSPPLESKLAEAVPTFVISRDILCLPHVYADIQCTRIYISGRRKLAWECKNSPDLPTLFKNEFKLTPRSTTLSYRRVRRSLA